MIFGRQREIFGLHSFNSAKMMNVRTNYFKPMVCILSILIAWISLAPYLAKNLVVEKYLERADVIVVLAGSAAYVERAHKAALLYKQGVANKILLTNDGGYGGWSQQEQRTFPYFELARRTLVAQGVPNAAIEILTPEVSGTISEAAILCKTVANSRWKSLLIVTSAYHTRRALWTFERIFAKNGLTTKIGIVSASVGPESSGEFYWRLSAHGWRDVAGEYVKRVFYYFNY